MCSLKMTHNDPYVIPEISEEEPEGCLQDGPLAQSNVYGLIHFRDLLSRLAISEVQAEISIEIIKN